MPSKQMEIAGMLGIGFICDKFLLEIESNDYAFSSDPEIEKKISVALAAISRLSLARAQQLKGPDF